MNSTINIALAKTSLLVTVILIASCKYSKQEKLFTSLKEAQTGVAFINKIDPFQKTNIFDYLYYYNGGGVAIGDINNDGLEDVYFTSNQGSNKLYLNKGKMKFEDITEKAGVAGKGNWKTGVTMADVNGDGLLDIYVSEVGGYNTFRGRNELFINNGKLGFTEQAAQYGLAIEGFNTQATFFDYDHDGDLDMFLVNHSVHSNATLQDSSMRHKTDVKAGDKLFRNELKNGTGKFFEVTSEAGIYSSVIGYGLNAMVGDLNNDGWEDIYVSNDFHEEDYYYVNQQNGTFKEMNKSAFAHESRFSMGSDMGDVNNDGWLDIFTLDMLPEDEQVLKESLSDDLNELYQHKQRIWKYQHQFSKNALQLNTGGGNAFSDISLYAGVAATDWSWAPLIADFNNDGMKDIFVSNGILKRPNNLDFLKYVSNEANKSAQENMRSNDRDKIQNMPSGKVANYVFEGTSDLKFINRSVDWGFDEPTLSNGAAYADLDNDGDQDIVVNNMNDPAIIYENNTNKITSAPHHYLSVQLKGDSLNPFAYGAKLTVTNDKESQYAYVTATRGFESASSTILHFGLGADSIVAELMVTWPDGKTATVKNIRADRKIFLNYHAVTNEAGSAWPVVNKGEYLLQDVTAAINLPYLHSEDAFNDLNVQELMPHKVSTQGPKIAVADINGDGLDDFFAGGAKGQAGKIFIQNKQGKFSSTNEQLLQADFNCEDVNGAFFDADNDGDNDLYVVSGGNEYFEGATPLYDRLYLNDSKGNFSKADLLPKIATNKSVAIASDVDHDGDMDLFVGGRCVTNRYGESPPSYLLLNNGKGKFGMAPQSQASDLNAIGMVTDAVWTDMDKDGWKDLVVVGEWMPVTVYKNNKGSLVNITASLNLQNTSGLWNTIKAADINGDGWDDLLVGNLGQNSKLHASEQFPLKMYAGDVSGNGFFDQILSVEKNGRYYSFLSKEEMEKRFPVIMRKKYLDYASFAGKTVGEVFGEGLKHTKALKIQTLSSALLLNTGKGMYQFTTLPAAVQYAPVYAFAAGQFNNDNYTDILCAGNLTGVSPFEGFYDAGYGTMLMGGTNGQLMPWHPWQSGLAIKGEVRDIKTIRTIKQEILYAFARNNNSILFFKKAEAKKQHSKYE